MQIGEWSGVELFLLKAAQPGLEIFDGLSGFFAQAPLLGG